MSKLSQQGVVDMVLTTIVNRDDILSNIRQDIENRFKTKLCENKLKEFLNIVDVKVNFEPIIFS